MFSIDPPDLPAFLDPLLEYLSGVLPSPVYDFLFTFLSYALTLGRVLFSLATTMLRSNPLEWDAQTIIPPLITALAAYLALLNLYKTTSWMIRTSFWFMKWGTILSCLIGGAGWAMGTWGNNNTGRGGSLTSALVGAAFDMATGKHKSSADDSRRRSTRRPSAERKTRSKPKPWDSFDRLKDWQNQQEDGGDGSGEAVQKIVQEIAGAAARTMKDSGWLDMAKGVLDRLTSENDDEGASSNKKSKTKAASRSR